jgi:hypothetical protein
MFLYDLKNGGNKFIWMFAEVWTLKLKSVSHHYVSPDYLFTKNCWGFKIWSVFFCDCQNGRDKFIWMFIEVWTFELKSVSHHHLSLNYLLTKNCWSFNTWEIFLCDLKNVGNNFICMFAEVWAFEPQSLTTIWVLAISSQQIAGALILRKCSCVTFKIVGTSLSRCLLRCRLLS